MAFIEKKDPVVLNIKLTSKGRELLSKGLLNFRYFAVGDSEIDYEFNRQAGFNSFSSNILRPADMNPQQLSFIPRNMNGDNFNEISNVPSTPTIIQNHVQPIGFFNESSNEILTDTDHVKQPDVAVQVSGVTGGTKLKLVQSPTYQANPNEPAVGDFLLVKWTNPLGQNTTGYDINKNVPTPYIWYKIQEITTGTTLAGNNLEVTVDRELPNFSGITGGSNNIIAGAHVYFDYINYTGDTYSTDNTDDALIAFLQNCQCPTVTFPFWNMSIIFTENIVGINPIEDRPFGQYNTRGFGGFVSYIQNQNKDDENYKKQLGIIHYTNNSVSNTYAEGFYGDPNNIEDISPIDKIPRLDIPTIMWHKATGSTLGLQLRATGSIKYLTGVTKSLNTRYFDLADLSGNIVGKVFYDLKIFLIEDQELLFAMSYKSNRSWTLPNYGVDINANVTYGCPECVLDYQLVTKSPTVIDGDDGQIIITGISNNVGQLILEILSGDTGTTGGTQVYFKPITGNTIITKSKTINGFGLSASTYTVKLSDLGSPNCTIISGATITAYAGNPTRIRFYNNAASIGSPFGTGYITVGPTGMTNTDLYNRFLSGEGSTGNDALTNWVAVPSGSYLEMTNLTFKQPYAIYTRDATGDTFSEINSSEAINSQSWTYYVAAGDPLSNPVDIVLTRGNDSGGPYVVISNYLDTPLNPAANPVVGQIEASVHRVGEPANNWVAISNTGSNAKIYLDEEKYGTYQVEIRERFGYIIMYKRTADGTFTY